MNGRMLPTDRHRAAPAVKAAIAAVALISAAACGGGPGAAPAATPTTGTGPTTGFAYRIPSPPEALYIVEDSVEVVVSTAAGDLDLTTKTLLTMNLVFGRDPAGIGVIGSVVGLDVAASSGVGGTRTANADNVQGPLAMVLARAGHVQVGAVPGLDSAVADLTPFPRVAYEIFPRLPAYPVGQGGTWVDTLTWAITDETSESATRSIYTYTLQGDTVIDGRTLLNFSVEGELAMQLIEGVGDALVDQRLNGSSTGYVLWDPERSLPRFTAMSRVLEGTNQVPGAGTLRTRVGGVIRIRGVF